MNKIEQFKMNRHNFNPLSRGDMIEVKKYFRDSKWENGCPFHLEWPYLDIPSMIKDKITSYTLKAIK